MFSPVVIPMLPSLVFFQRNFRIVPKEFLLTLVWLEGKSPVQSAVSWISGLPSSF
jgi:hypothetical protein